jgi:hypothetical protein
MTAARTGSPSSPRCAACTGSPDRTRLPSPPRTTGGTYTSASRPASRPASTISRWPGIDIRPPGYRTSGYLAGPGSVVDGAEYVIDRDVPAAPLPRHLGHADLLREQTDGVTGE